MIIYAMVVALALASALLAGYQSTGETRYTWMHNIGFATVIALTMYVIIDLEYPRPGWIRSTPSIRFC